MAVALGLTTAGVAGLVAGYVVARSWLRFYAVAAAGLAAIACAVWVIVDGSPTGDGWSDRTEFFGHWVPTTELNATVVGAPALWVAGLMVGAVAWFLRSRSADDGV